MADNITLNAGSGGSVLATDDVGGVHYQIGKMAFGALESATLVVLTNGLPVQLQTGHADVNVSLDGEAVVLGAGAAAIGKLAENNGVDIGDVDVTSVPAPLNVTGGGTEAAALRVTLANDSTGVVTVDGNVTADLGTLGGAATEAKQDTVIAAVDGLEGSVADCVTSLQIMDDWDETNRAAVNVIPSQTGVAAGNGSVGANTLRVTVADDSTGLLSVDDNGSSLTVDTTGTSGLEIVQPTAADLNMTETSSAAIAGSVAVLADWDDDADHCEVVGAAAENAAVSGAPVRISGQYDSAERTTDDGDATTLATSPQGWMMVGNQSGYLFDGATRCQIKRVNVITSTDGADLIAAVAAKKFRCLAMSIHATSATATNVYFEDEDGTDVWGSATGFLPLAVDADGDNVAGMVLPFNQAGWFETPVANKDLEIKLSAAQTVVVSLVYIEVA